MPGSSRVVLIFPELRPFLEDAQLVAGKNDEYVITLPALRRDRYANIGVQMARYVRKAGLTPWQKLFQNLRSTRQTELVAVGYSEQVVCEWMGNSRAVAKKFYLQVTDADYAQASGQTPPISAGTGTGQGAQEGTQGQAPALSDTLGQTVQKALKAKGLGEAFAAISHLLVLPENTPNRI